MIVRLESGELRDQIRQPLYDTITLTSANAAAKLVAKSQFFTDVAGKLKWQTNLTQNSALSTARSFRIQGLSFHASSCDGAKLELLNGILNYSSLELIIGEKTYYESCARFVAGKIDAELAATGTNATAVYAQHSQFGAPSQSGIALKGKEGLSIEPLEQFRVDWSINVPSANITACTPSANKDIHFVMCLKGMMRRPVQ